MSATERALFANIDRIIRDTSGDENCGQTRILVIAGSFAEFNAFLLETGMQENGVTYVNRPSTLRMFRATPQVHVVMYGNYWDNAMFNPETIDESIELIKLHMEAV